MGHLKNQRLYLHFVEKCHSCLEVSNVLEAGISAYKAISNGYISGRRALNTELLVLFMLVLEEVVNCILTTPFP